MIDLSDSTRRRIGYVLILLTASIVAADSVLGVRSGDTGKLVENLLLGTSFTVVLTLAIRAVPRNGAVWVMIWAALLGTLSQFGTSIGVARSDLTAEQLVSFDIAVSPSQIDPWAAFGISLGAALWVPAIFLLVNHLLILFPSGTAATRRWRTVAWISAVSMAVMTVAALLLTAPWVDVTYEELLADDLAAGRWFGMLMLVLMLIAVASVVHLIRRYRSSVGEERLQYRWITWALALNVANIFAFSWTNEVISTSLLAAIPIAFGIAITKYRLYDLDLVVSRSVAYGALAAFIAGVYALIVVGLGSLLGQGDEPNLALSIAATALIALLFEPVHARLQRFANRLVYGSRATPYAVLSTLTSRLAASEASASALDQLAEAVANGIGAVSSSVWIRVGDRLRLEAVWPPDSLTSIHPRTSTRQAIEADLVVPVVEAGEELGAIAIGKAASDQLTDGDRRLVNDVAAGAALLLRNMQLTTQLEERAQQLRASRRRLVAAHDAERHRLERDLHDGAQQQVVALKVKLGIARTLAEREDAADVAGLAASLADQVQQTVDAMRAVAHGIYPPLLESDGLEAAMAAAARSAVIQVEMAAEQLGRFPREIEETAFFCVVEAIEAARLAGATAVGIEVIGSSQGLAIEIDHDGPTSAAGFQAVIDRVEAFAGTIDIESAAGSGSRTAIYLPTPELAIKSA